MKTNNKAFTRLVRECIESEDCGYPSQQITLLTFDDIVNIILLTTTALRSEDTFISESHKGKDKRYSHTYPRVNRMSSSRCLHK